MRIQRYPLHAITEILVARFGRMRTMASFVAMHIPMMIIIGSLLLYMGKAQL